jgi:hypothetical protein
VLYRVFRMTPGATPFARGGHFHVPRDRQGAGRHDDPTRYGALYVSHSPAGAVAEVIQQFRGRDLDDDDLVRSDGTVLALAAFDDAALGRPLDLDDPAVLQRDGWRPSRVASRERSVTQPMAVAVHDRGGLGLSWWSTLDSAWTNVTLFAERVFEAGALALVDEPERLTVTHPAVVAAADRLVVPIKARRARRGRRR